MFEKWLDSVLCGNILLDTTKCLGFDVSVNKIRMYTYESIVDGIPQKATPINVLNELRWDVYKEFDYVNDYSEREKMWNYYICTVEALLKQYINIGKSKNKLLSFSEMSIGFGFCKIKKISK
ncbi:MAG: hypothetical protein IKP77_05640 [Acholeplasmatales bacterium]|nr:hypothetical protein [Acholeplasmatales bacterium]MBR6288569.1 hypothetical protein [Acholeplasmatales bacterium]